MSLEKINLIKVLKEKADAEETAADVEYGLMSRLSDKNPHMAAKHSDAMKKHRYAAAEFRKIVKQLEAK